MKLLAATFLAQLAVLTVGAGAELRAGRLPSPRRFVAAWLLWFVLGIAAAFGPNVSRAAGRLAALVVLLTLLSKTIGRQAIGFLDSAASLFNAGAQPAPANLTPQGSHA